MKAASSPWPSYVASTYLYINCHELQISLENCVLLIDHVESQCPYIQIVASLLVASYCHTTCIAIIKHLAMCIIVKCN